MFYIIINGPILNKYFSNHIHRLHKYLADEMQISLDLSPALSDAIVERGYSPAYGARPLRRAVQALCEDAVAEASLDGFVGEGESLGLDSDGASPRLPCSSRPPPTPPSPLRRHSPHTLATPVCGHAAARRRDHRA